MCKSVSHVHKRVTLSQARGTKSWVQNLQIYYCYYIAKMSISNFLSDNLFLNIPWAWMGFQDFIYSFKNNLSVFYTKCHTAVYFDQLLGDARTRKLVEIHNKLLHILCYFCSKLLRRQNTYFNCVHNSNVFIRHGKFNHKEQLLHISTNMGSIS